MAVLAGGVVGGGANFNDNKSLIKYLKIFSSLGQVARRKISLDYTLYQRGFNTKRPTIVFYLGPTKPLPSYD